MQNKYSRHFESYFINWFYVVTFKLHRIFVLQKDLKLFDYINSESIGKHQIQRMGILKKWPTLENFLKVDFTNLELTYQIYDMTTRPIMSTNYDALIWKITLKIDCILQHCILHLRKSLIYGFILQMLQCLRYVVSLMDHKTPEGAPMKAVGAQLPYFCARGRKKTSRPYLESL